MATAVRLPATAAHATVPAAAKVARAATPAPRLTAGPPAVRLTPAPGTTLQPTTAGGAPMMPSVRHAIERSFNVDLRATRVHTNSGAARGMSARAFAFGPNIFLGPGERDTDLGLLAHESAHVVQQAGGLQVQRWAAGAGDRFEAESHRASAAVLRGAPFSVRERTAPRAQLFGLGTIRDFAADHANDIPGFQLLTIVIGVNPINGAAVPPSAANILRALMRLTPAGALLVRALDSYGVFDKAGAWVEQQLKGLGLVGSAIKDAFVQFLARLEGWDFVHPEATWEKAKKIFTGPIDQLLDFAKGAAVGILALIKEAVLRPLAKLAEGTPAYDLLKAVLGQDPVTGDKVEPNADMLISGFMKLIGKEEIWNTMKQARAVPRAWAWFQGALKGVRGFVQELPPRVIAAFQALVIEDLLDLPGAFGKIKSAFGDFFTRFFDWAGSTIWNLLEIICDVVSPGALVYIKKTGAALKSILENPLPFVGNLVKAAKLGFQNFADNFGTHLKAGLIGWLTGALPGIYIPKAFELREIVKFALSVLGLSWANVRLKLVKAVGEPAVLAMEAGFKIVTTLVTEGPAAAWEQIKNELGNLQSMVIGGITDFVIDMVVQKAIPKLVAMFIPGAGFLSAIVSIYDTVMVFVNRIKTIIEVVTGFIDSIVAIAAGAVGPAAAKVEKVLAGVLSLAINFLAGFAGLGKVADKIMKVFDKVRAPIDKALDGLVAWIVRTAKKLFAKAFGKDNETPEEKKKRLHEGTAAAVRAVNKYAGKRVGELLLKPLLLAVRVRYRLTSLEPIKQGDNWAVRAEINPIEIAKTDAKTGKDKVTMTIEHEVDWPLDEFRSKANAIKKAAEKKKAGAVKTLPEGQSTKPMRRGGQAKFRAEIHAFIDLVEEIDKGAAKEARGLMRALQADHQQELQMSGTDEAQNMAMIEQRMNSQMGAKFRARLATLDAETVIEEVEVKDDAKKAGVRKTGKARELLDLLLPFAGKGDRKVGVSAVTVRKWFKLD